MRIFCAVPAWHLSTNCFGGPMNNLNSTIVEGNAVRKPELRTSPKGTSICIFPLAVNRYYKNSSGTYDEEVSYFNVETYGKLAELCADITEKGQGLRVVGRLKQARWKNSEGKNVSRVFIIAEHIEFKRLKKSEPDKKDSVTPPENAAAEEVFEEESEGQNEPVKEMVF